MRGSNCDSDKQKIMNIQDGKNKKLRNKLLKKCVIQVSLRNIEKK